MKIGNAELIILLVELEKEGIQALGGMVHRSRVGRVKNVGFPSSREGDINVSLGNFPSRSSVSVNSHGSKVDNVSINFGVNNGTAQVVRSRDIVVHGVTLGFGCFHGVGSSTLFGKVDNGVWFFLLDELHKEVVLLGNINVDKFNIFPRHFFPCFDANIRRLNRRKRITSQLRINIPPTQIIHHDNIMSLIAQIQRRGPAAETVSAEDDHLLFVGAIGDSIGGDCFGVELKVGQ
mmetsp:Transcript_3390/g.7479  ORF Transcript_3390/g.7479 Transcript_3390/m.7479 type:complete len:234 (+) Transcript_3390:720-1421(+)